MNTIRLIACIVLTFVLTGCGDKPHSQDAQTTKPHGIDLGFGVVLGTAVAPDGYLIKVVLYNSIDVVCLEANNNTGRDCRPLKDTSKKIQDLAQTYSRPIIGCGISACE